MRCSPGEHSEFLFANSNSRLGVIDVTLCVFPTFIAIKKDLTDVCGEFFARPLANDQVLDLAFELFGINAPHATVGGVHALK
ncbi:MAG: hypothetical protein P3C10_02210, partial [Gemmatimonadota bacterium]|nr:hypothetical protein [Gemmatimonadota bacterium]